MSDIPITTIDAVSPNGDESPSIADLRAAADRGNEARAEADAAKRELAFVKAGIDTESGVGKLLFESYKGDATKDAVLAAAQSYGINPSAADETPAPPAVQIDDSEREQSRERAALAAGAETPGGQVDEDPHAAGLAAFHEARKDGLSTADASTHYFNRVFEAAYAKGDPRAIFDADAHRQAAQAG